MLNKIALRNLFLKSIHLKHKEMNKSMSPTSSRLNKINRYYDIMDPILTKLHDTAKLTSDEFMTGYNETFIMSSSDKDGNSIDSSDVDIRTKAAYDYLKNYLIRIAPTVTVSKYKDIAQTIIRFASYMHRAFILINKLVPLFHVAEQQLDLCLPDIK